VPSIARVRLEVQHFQSQDLEKEQYNPSGPRQAGAPPAICAIFKTTNSAGLSGVNPTTILTTPQSMAAWVVVVVASHRTKEAVSGVTPAGKGSRAYNRYQSDALHGPNPCTAPIKAGPFYTIKLMIGDLGTYAGIRTDKNAGAPDTGGRPIAGLYAIGNDMASIMGGNYRALRHHARPRADVRLCRGEAYRQRNSAGWTALGRRSTQDSANRSPATFWR
jgi:hypothetical protein